MSGIIVQQLCKSYVHKKRKLFRSFTEEKIALTHVDMAIPKGQVTGLLGLNGAGKTTAIKILCTLLLPTAGNIQVDGLDIVRDALQVRRRVNMIAGGERMLYWRLTGRENLWYFAQLYNVERQQVKDRIKYLIHLVGLDEAADIPVERYSKGMKQRLQIARGLINDPSYLLLDEPTLGLDIPIARELRLIIHRLAEEGKGILLTSHYLPEIEALCSNIYLLHKGRLIASGSPADLKALTQTDRLLKVLLPDITVEMRATLLSLGRQSGAKMNEKHDPEGYMIEIRHRDDITGQVIDTIISNGGSILKLETTDANLEDAILKLTDSTNQQTEENIYVIE